MVGEGASQPSPPLMAAVVENRQMEQDALEEEEDERQRQELEREMVPQFAAPAAAPQQSTSSYLEAARAARAEVSAARRPFRSTSVGRPPDRLGSASPATRQRGDWKQAAEDSQRQRR